jgi:hypothetical protein
VFVFVWRRAISHLQKLPTANATLQAKPPTPKKPNAPQRRARQRPVKVGDVDDDQDGRAPVALQRDLAADALAQVKVGQQRLGAGAADASVCGVDLFFVVVGVSAVW